MASDKLVMSGRTRVVTRLASAGGLLIAGCSSREFPPTYGNVLRMADLLTYRAFRMLLPARALVREYSHERHHFGVGGRDIESG